MCWRTGERGVLEGQGLSVPVTHRPRARSRPRKGGVGFRCAIGLPEGGGKRGDHPKGSRTLGDGGGQWRACWNLEQDLGCRIDSGEGACSGKGGSRGRGHRSVNQAGAPLTGARSVLSAAG